MNLNPMEQFAVKPLAGLDKPLFEIAGHPIYFTNQALLMVIVVAVSSLFLSLAVKPNRLVPTRGQSMAEMSYEFVSNMIHSATGEDGLRFFPFVFTLFIFVLCCNFFGMVPGSFTVTSQIAVTFALAALVIGLVIVTGFMKHGIGFLKLFVPHAPWYLLILLIPIEVISFLTRPISLSVRLFANMLAGHTMLAVFGGFVVALGSAGGILSALSIAPMLLIVAIMLLELLVAFLQAYVFAILTCSYLNEALHRQRQEERGHHRHDHHQQRLIGEIDRMARDLEQRLVQAGERLDGKLFHRVQVHEPLSLSDRPLAISALISCAARITLRIPAAAPSTKNKIMKAGRV